jgi:SHS2 domain-containing protein
MASPYELLDHTADLRVRVTGTDRAELYENAGLALFDLITRSEAGSPQTVTPIRVTGADPADLMVNFLRELLYLWTGDGKLVGTIAVGSISDTAIDALVTAGRHDPDRHRIRHEIKAVTYHQIDVRRTADGWQATVIFDI